MPQVRSEARTRAEPTVEAIGPSTAGMRVAVVSYPTVFQSPGGIRMKMGRTISALRGIGIDARLVDTARERFDEYDLVHVFGAFNSNHRIVQQARSDGVPVVVSTILNPPFTRWEGRRARFLDRLVGRLTNYEVTTSYRQIQLALQDADHLVVLGTVERQIVTDAYGISVGKVSIVPNGIGEEFFSADPLPFVEKYKLTKPFVLHVGNVGNVKNQLGLVRALHGLEVDVVLVGYAGQAENEYLEACKGEGGDRVHYLGELAHGPMLASAFAAARVFALPSRHEGMPNAVLEALACDRPVVMTRHHTMDLALPADIVAQVEPDDHAAIRRAVECHLQAAAPMDGRARSIVSSLSWASVARKLEDIYRQALRSKRQGLTGSG